MRKLNFFVALFFFPILLLNCKKEETESPQTGAVNYEDSLKKGLWAYFDFNSGYLGDHSGNNLHLKGFNGLGFSYDLWGNHDNALEFDGIDDYAVIEAGKNFPEGDFTISFLMMPKLTSGRVFQKADFNDARGASFGFGFDPNPASQKINYEVTNWPELCTTQHSPSNTTVLSLKKTIHPYAWYLVTIQHTNGLQKIYINGLLTATKPTLNKTVKTCTTAPFYLGMWWLQDKQPFAGKIDELRIYTRALSDKEIWYLFARLT